MIFNTNEWYDIPGFSGIYQINTKGQVRSNTKMLKGDLLINHCRNGYIRIKQK